MSLVRVKDLIAINQHINKVAKLFTSFLNPFSNPLEEITATITTQIRYICYSPVLAVNYSKANV